MARALGEDLRLRALKAADEGASARQAAVRLGLEYRARSAGLHERRSGNRRRDPKGVVAGRASMEMQTSSSG